MDTEPSDYRPEFATNEEGQSVAGALQQALQYLGDKWADPYDVSIATAYFNPEGFNLIADELEEAGRVRLLLGTEPQNPLRQIRSLGDGAPPQRQEQESLKRALDGHREHLEEDRNLLGFTMEADSQAKRLVGWLESDNVEVRLLKDQFLHGKAFLVDSDDYGVLAGSSNFTAGGLARNLELNLGQYQPHVVRRVREWYENLWEQADSFDLASIYSERYEPHSPYLIYLRMLYEQYGDEIEREAEDRGTGIHLTTFQEDGLWRAKRILEKHNGVIIADGVGLGKTFIAGELIREAVEERRQRVLLVAPATLRDGPWSTFLDQRQLYAECVSYQELAQSPQLNPDATGSGLNRDIDKYAMVVIDEAHAYRNEDTLRSETLQRLLSGTPAKDVVMLTATPVNNSLWDLYHLIDYFVPNDAVFADAGITSLRDYFKEAMAQDPDALSPEHLFDVLDEIAVRRTRHFVKRYYPNETIPVDGEEMTITFPEPSVRSVEYEFGELLPNFFEEFAEALDYDPEEDNGDQEEGLTLARYMPSQYNQERGPETYEVQVTGLLRSGLLKRFESSAHAFAGTCRQMAKSHEEFLRFLDEGYVASGQLLREWIATDSDELDEVIGGEEEGLEDGLEPADPFDVEALRRDVERDRELLLEFAERAETVTHENDPKLARLADELEKIADQAAGESITEKEERDRRKVLIFSYYADTVEWVREYLEEVCSEREGLTVYEDRIESTSGRRDNREDVLFGFAPDSTDAPPGQDEDRYDIVVATDVLAEGVNLQQVRHIINYDLPWNPMRLVQRHGRIDRIGSPHDRVYIRCIFPDEELEDLLQLEERLQQKISQAAASIGVESEVIPGSEVSDLTFAETRDEIQELREGNAEIFEEGGETGSAFSGEEYRQELRGGLEQTDLAERVRGLPWGSGSGKAVPGAEPGYVFCARIADHDRPYFRYVPAEETDPEPVGDLLSCLAHAHSGPETGRVLDEEMRQGAYEAWTTAKQDIFRDWQRATDPRNLQPEIPKAMREAAAFLREHPPPDIEQQELDEYLDAIEAPVRRPVQQRFRSLVRSAQEGNSEAEVAQQIVDTADKLGLEPTDPVEALPPISTDDIHLVCWMAITPAEGETEAT
ncbi:hypothetical protein GGP50_003245 [Salinibacter ruber]|uniref:helicase-related protein n=1 Tax=Salinibacter ruber TaxID=146919 RepID=UPI0021693625|nr:helicase-related protein [Salinibacter ruber]MCS4195008.1 hypothetical protein [Salinibacter ruber]